MHQKKISESCRRVIADAAIVVSSFAETLQIVLLSVSGPSAASVKLRFLDEEADELGNRVSNQKRVLFEPLSPQSPPSLKRLSKALGVKSLLVAKAKFPISQTIVNPWKTLGIEVSLEGDSPRRMYVERSKRNWGLVSVLPRAEYAFLLTNEQIAKRIDWIAGQCGLDMTLDEASSDSLTKLYFKILGGYDSPLISKEFDNE